jgi:predicted enzyme related to lactoylglutathione lyase
MPGEKSKSLTLEVADLDAAMAAVRASGTPVVHDIQDFPPCRMFSIQDPDGNQIGLHQRKAK